MDIMTFEMAFTIITCILTAGTTFGALRFQIIQNSKDIKEQQILINRLLTNQESVMMKTEINNSDIAGIKRVQSEERENIKLIQIALQDLKIIVTELKTVLNGLRSDL